MANYRVTNDGAWVEVDTHGNILRLVDAGQHGEIQPYQSQLPDAQPVHMVASSAVQQVQMKTSYTDRAHGFNIKTRWLAVPVAAVAALVAYTGYSVPILSVSMLTIIAVTYMAVWLAAFVWSELTSADGVSLFHTWQGWRYLRREQNERFNYYRRQERRQ